MPKEKLSNELRSLAIAYVNEKARAKEHTNAVNRLKTQLKNFFKERIIKKEWQLGTYAVTSGLRLDYSANESTYIDPEDFLEMYQKKKITKEQFLKCISVQKGAVSTHLGSDIALQLERETEGDKLDIRIKELSIDENNQDYLFVPQLAKTPKVRRRVLGEKPKAAPTAAKRMKRVRLKGKTSK